MPDGVKCDVYIIYFQSDEPDLKTEAIQIADLLLKNPQ